MSQMAAALSQRKLGKLPSQIVINSKGVDHAEVNAVTLRSGTQLEEQPRTQKRTRRLVDKGDEQGKTDLGDGKIASALVGVSHPIFTIGHYDEEIEKEKEETATGHPNSRLVTQNTEAITIGRPDSRLIPQNQKFKQSATTVPTIGRLFKQPPMTSSNPPKVSTNSVPNSYTSCVPFPHKFMKSKKEHDEKDILKTSRKVQVNISLRDAINHVSKYAKFLKEFCTNKRRVGEHETIALSEEVCTVLQRKLPPKLKDPGRFTIPCTIGEKRFEKALLDLGASSNIMSFSVYEALNLGELKETKLTIQLADNSYSYPRGKLENVLVHVNELIFPADFFVLKMEQDMPTSFSLILGRSFMRTAHTKIDVYEGTLTMEFEREVISFNIFP